MNASDVKAKLSTPGGRADLLSKSDEPESEKVRELYLAAFSREPRADEVEGGRGVSRQATGRPAGQAARSRNGPGAKPTRTCSGRSSTPKSSSTITNIMRKTTLVRFVAGMMGFWLGAASLAQEVCLPAPRLLTMMPMGGQAGTSCRGHDHGREHRRGERAALLRSQDHRETEGFRATGSRRRTRSSSRSPPTLPRACTTPA